MAHASQVRRGGGRWVARGATVAALLTSLALACTTTPPVTTPTPTPTATTTASSPAPTAPPQPFDFGDAPDPTYPSLLASNGARTKIIDQFWLGNLRTPSVTSELDAKVIDGDELDDGLEGYVPFGGQATLVFRAVKSTAAPAGIVYFNLLVDLDGDGIWQGDDWVEQNRKVDIPAGGEMLIEVSVPGPIDATWLRAALTDSSVPADPAVGWAGTGEFAIGEIEDYFLPAGPTETPVPTPYETPYATPTPYYTELPTEGPTSSPSEGPTATPGGTPNPSPTFIPTGDFVVVCDPAVATVIHGESVEISLKLVSGAHTPPERFRGRIPGGSVMGEELGVDPPADEDGWSAWADGATLTVTSTHVDPPARKERVVVVLILQSPSTTREVFCIVDVTHTEPSPSPSEATIPTISVSPTTVTIPTAGSAFVDIEGTGFTSAGEVELVVTVPNGIILIYDESADAQGKLVARPLQLPPGSPTGEWLVTATDAATGGQAEATFEVR